MSDIVFSSPPWGFKIVRESDGRYRCVGSLNGQPIVAAAPTSDGNFAIVLIDPGAEKSSKFENLLCLDRNGNVVWRAGLPAAPDSFLSFSILSDSVEGVTWSGFKVLLDLVSGQELKRDFVK